jgi:hypothetical protein
MLHAIPWATLRQRDGKYLCQTLDEARVLALTGKFPESKTIDEFLAIGVQSDPGSLLDQGSFPFDKRLSRIIGDLPALPGFTKELSKLGRLSYFNPDRGAFLSLLQKTTRRDSPRQPWIHHQERGRKRLPRGTLS